MSSTDRAVIRVDGTTGSPEIDSLAVEAPLEIRVGTTPIAVLMRTPGDERHLVAGFALTEGILVGPHEIGSIEEVMPDRWRLEPASGIVIDPEQFRRNLYSTSSCGVCGKASIDAVRIASAPLPDGPQVDPRVLTELPTRLRSRQPVFDATGGLHAAGLFDGDGVPLAVAEDVGRHNAVDKVVGLVSATRWPIGPVVLAVSGRVSFEIVQKAAVAGIPMVVGVSAASSLAAELAEDVGMTLAGFTRAGSFVLYTGERRVAIGGSVPPA